MTQVSRPILIVLLASVALAGVWLVALRPKAADTTTSAPTATAPGEAGLGRAIAKAKGAVSTSQSAAQRSEQAAASASGDAPATATSPATNSSKTSASPSSAAPVKRALPKLDPGDRSRPILRQLAHGKVAVVLFFNSKGADDHAAMRAVRAADRHHGRVAVHMIPIRRVGDYNALTADVPVLQAPTVLVIGPDRKARTVVGYTEVKMIDQTIADVGGRRFRPAGSHPAHR